MEYIERNSITYGFVRDFKHEQDFRLSFNKLTQATFGFSLENWYQNGFWTDNYIPYSLLHNNEVISNVSVNKMEFVIENKRKTGIQIGTVMTHDKYRHQGLNRFLMEQVIKEWEDLSDFIYLFANDSVLDFYPKFNFESIVEYQYSKSVNLHNNPSSLEKLNIDIEKDRTFLIDTINRSIPISRVAMLNNAALIMFYCLSYKKNSIFYMDELKAIAIADYEGETLFLNDVFSKQAVDLNEVIQIMSGKYVKRVVLGFTPFNEMDYNRSILNEGDTLFVLKDKLSYFKDNQCRFPVLSHA